MIKVIFTMHVEEMLHWINFYRDMPESVIDNPDWKEENTFML